MIAEAATKYKFEDLRIGMEVRKSQLSDIFGKNIILINTNLLANNDVEGEVAYLDNGNVEEYEKWFDQSDIPITPIYKNEDLRDGVEYDEELS